MPLVGWIARTVRSPVSPRGGAADMHSGRRGKHAAAENSYAASAA